MFWAVDTAQQASSVVQSQPIFCFICPLPMEDLRLLLYVRGFGEIIDVNGRLQQVLADYRHNNPKG